MNRSELTSALCVDTIKEVNIFIENQREFGLNPTNEDAIKRAKGYVQHINMELIEKVTTELRKKLGK